MKIKLLVDSTCDLPIEFLHEHDVTVIPLLVTFGEEEYQDLLEISTPELYQKVEEKNMLPKTAARSIAFFEEIFKKFLKEGYDKVMYLGISSKFSSMVPNAIIASKAFKNQVFIHDTENLSTGEGIQILKTLKWIEEGKTPEEILKLLKELVPKVRIQFAVENLEYLYKGGRCSQTSYYLGKGFKIKPIIRVVDGGMIVYKKSVGKMHNALDKLVEILKSDLHDLDLDQVIITHSIAPESLTYLQEKLLEFIPKDHLMVTEAGCVISSHCGAGTIGILYTLK